MNNLGDIRLFVEAANLGGLSAAGRKLGLSPAAASARLIKLESVLHTRLFERTTRHLRLTDEGRAYLAYCQQAVQALDDGQAFLQAGESVVRGKVRISDFAPNFERFERGSRPPRISVAMCSRTGLTSSTSNTRK